MLTDHDSIVEALRAAGEFSANVEGLNGFWQSAANDVLRRAESAIPAVESLVAENARLRAALEKHEGPAVTDTCSVCGEAVERLRTAPPDYWWRHVAPEHRFLHDVVRAPSRETTE